MPDKEDFTVEAHFSLGYLFLDAFGGKHHNFKKAHELSSHEALIFAGEDEEGVKEPRLDQVGGVQCLEQRQVKRILL